MNTTRRSSRFALLTAAVTLAFTLLPAASDAQYIGLEPQRIVALLDQSASGGEDETARVTLAVSLFREGKPQAALDALGPPTDRETPRLGYARLLLKLHTEHDLRFSGFRTALRELLQTDPFFSDVFDVWLGLNPQKKELRSYLEVLRPLRDPRADWQRAEVLLRLGDAQQAVRVLQETRGSDVALQNRVDHALARAHFQMKADAAGQAAYQRLLARLDDTTANFLFQDIAAIASSAEREEFATLSLEKKAEFFRRFWASRHPIPVQEANPRLAEHYRRLAQALADYALQSNGRGFFTDPDVFRSLSPALTYFDSMVLFAEGPASRYWFDARGLMLLRHGQPTLLIPARRYGDSGRDTGTEITESWFVNRYLSRPMLFHFIERPAVGEWTLVLNLAVAAARRGASPDDPEKILRDLTQTASYRALYESRLQLHPVYQQILEARSQLDLGRALRAESELMAGYLKAAVTFDATGYYTRENTLPLAVSVSNFYAHGRPAIEVDFATDLRKAGLAKLGHAASLHATVILYDRNWTELHHRIDEDFAVQPLPSGEFGAFLGRLRITDLEPEEYRLALYISQQESGRISVAKGGHEVTYIGQGSLGLSDPLLLQPTRANTKTATKEAGDAADVWMPMPDRVVRRSFPSRLEFELYNLQPDDAGNAHYEVEERVLTLYEKPSFLKNLASYGAQFGQVFFPLYAFASQVGASVLSQATASETEGLKVSTRQVTQPSADAITEEVKTDLRGLKPGVYTVYVTVRDLHANEITSRFLTLQVD